MEIQALCQFELASLTQKEKAIFYAFPADYQAFLREANGGILTSANQWFSVPITRMLKEKSYQRTWNAIEQFWAYLSYSNAAPREEGVYSILHEHLDRHVHEEFLPKGVYAIAHCTQNSLLCLSTNKNDFGAIYYWEWYWQYPWYKPFFDHRIAQVFEQIANTQAIIDDPNHPEYETVYNALNYATIVKVNDSFTDFINNLRSESDAEGEDG